MERMFRLLRADEIDARVATLSPKGATVLLYKDARVDQNVLDETVGPNRWQRKHEVIDGNLYCSVGIFFTEVGWVWKQDVGVESYTEKEKGQASDSFKRACFNWGIGRELYTAPFVFIPSSEIEYVDGKSGNKTTYDKFTVSSIGYDKDGNINQLQIKRARGNKVVFSFGKTTEKAGKQPEEIKDEKINETQLKALITKYPKKEQIDNICEHFNITRLEDMTVKQLSELISAGGKK